MWAILLPLLLFTIFSKCLGTCKVDEPGWESGTPAHMMVAEPVKDDITTVKQPGGTSDGNTRSRRHQQPDDAPVI